MDKKVVIFFFLFTLLMIGGSLVLCLWVFPNYLIYPTPDDPTGLIPAESETVATSIDSNSQKTTKVGTLLMISQMIGAVCIVLLVGMRLKKWFRENKPSTPQGYIFKITRITGKSAHDVFCKAAEDWPVSEEQIEEDFKKFVSDDSIPYYVNDFIRKNKKHIDEMRTSIFMFRGIE